MSTAAELLLRLRAAGGRIALDGDDLDIEAPDDVLTDTVLETVQERKRELLEALRAERAKPGPRRPGSAAAAPPPTSDAAFAPRPARPPIPEHAEPQLRARLLAAAESRAFPPIVLPALGLVVGREAWARLANRIGERFLLEVLEEIQGMPLPPPGQRSTPLDRTGGTSR